MKWWLTICNYSFTLQEDDSYAVESHNSLKVSFESSLNYFGKPELLNNLLSLLCQKSLQNILKSKLYKVPKIVTEEASLFLCHSILFPPFPQTCSSFWFKIVCLLISITTAAYLISHMPSATVRVKGEFIASFM